MENGQEEVEEEGGNRLLSSFPAPLSCHGKKEKKRNLRVT